MIYRSKIRALIILSKHVKAIRFNPSLLVSLDCCVCQRAYRTVVLFKNRAQSFCTSGFSKKHPFPGQVVSLDISKRQKLNMFSSKSTVAATYLIEYEFETFTDKKYGHSDVTPEPTWSRVAFELTCACGTQTQAETQNNIVRPWTNVCQCGRALYYERQETPLFIATYKV